MLCQHIAYYMIGGRGVVLAVTLRSPRYGGSALRDVPAGAPLRPLRLRCTTRTELGAGDEVPMRGVAGRTAFAFVVPHGFPVGRRPLAGDLAERMAGTDGVAARGKGGHVGFFALATFSGPLQDGGVRDLIAATTGGRHDADGSLCLGRAVGPIRRLQTSWV